MEKILDGVNFIKAKIKQDELEQLLITVTSQDNWQASTKELHEVANAAYNYEKWQKINDFIWDKLRKSKSWKKILKTLSLVEFLLKNGPTSIISSFKYEVYHFRSFDTFSAASEGVDRGQSIREKAKSIVELLSNDELLDQERLKAKTIRQKMAGVVGDRGMQYGGYSSSAWDNQSSKYQSYNSKSYDPNSLLSQESGLGTYGNYNYEKSTLDKYKDSNKKTNNTNSNSTNSKTQEHQQPTNDIPKKAFEKIAPKLIKPGAKPPPKPESPQKKNQTKSNNIIDDDIFTVIEKTNTETVKPKNNSSNNNNIFGQFTELTTTPTPTTTTPNNIPTYTQPNNPPTINYTQPLINQPFTFPSNNQFPQQNTTFPQTNSQFPQPSYTQFPNAHYGVTQVGYIQNQYYNTPQPTYPNYVNPQQHSFQQPTSYPTNQLSLNLDKGISLQVKAKQEQGFGSFESANQSNQNVKWMTSQQKNLTDFSDFTSQIKKESTPSIGGKKDNNIKVDIWNW